MKRIVTLLAVMAFAMATAFAQNVTLRFTGATSDGTRVRMDSVQVQNISRSWSETLIYDDTTLIFRQTGLADVHDGAAELSAYPNPLNGKTTVEISVPQSGEATLRLFNLAGQKVAEQSLTLQSGINRFEVRLQFPQVYLLSVTTRQGQKVIKLFNRVSAGENSIAPCGYGAAVFEKRRSDNLFQSGDLFRIVGYTVVGRNLVVSQEITQSISGSQVITILFDLSRTLPRVRMASLSIRHTSTSFSTEGEVIDEGGSPVTSRGICWSLNRLPTVSDNYIDYGRGVGQFACNVTGLTRMTTYYFRFYATNAFGTIYTSEQSITTSPDTATITTASVTNVGDSSATCGGTITDDGGVPVTARGIYWSQSPYVSGLQHQGMTTDGTGTGSFTSRMTGLLPNTTYYVRAYAETSEGTSYGNVVSFTTTAPPSNLPTVTTTAVSSLSNTSATCGGNVTSAGGSAVTARGVCWSTSNNPVVSGSHTTDGSGVGSFTSNLTNLTPNTTYFVRAYATNSYGTAYGNQITITTASVVMPTVTTSAATNITTTSASCGGTIVNNGNLSITARGLCWGTSQNPDLTGLHSSGGTGSGSFTATMPNLTPGTTYYVRAYATTPNGTVYGNQITFTTVAVVMPTVTTTSASNITATSAHSGGTIVNTGNLAITARGLCWGTSQNPDTNGLHSSGGTGSGTFTTTIPNLAANTTYYVRAYATTSYGTVYGNQISFTTSIAFANAAFSVSSNTTVYFSPGNLQWSATNGGTTQTSHTVAVGRTATGTWRFALHQWDVVGSGNSQASLSYTGWIDLFGWGTSGYSIKYPYNTSRDTTGYATGTSDIASTNYDWGVFNSIYNPITNSTDSPGTWRTLTHNEWDYLLNTRSTSSGIRYAKAVVNGMSGLIILPDNWRSSVYALSSTNTPGAAFTSNTITASNWATLESAGAIFLPAAGMRNNTSVVDVGLQACYWTSSAVYTDAKMWLVGNSTLLNSACVRYTALSVRLVKNTQ